MTFSTTKTALTLAASLAALTVALPAQAADSDTPAADTDAVTNDGNDDNEIVVTAGKREQDIQDVPSAVTALGEDVFTLQGIGRSANEVLALVPNASAGTQQHGRPRWWIRGVGAGQQQIDLANPVGFYLDEVYISNASATGLPLFDLERVEVLRGPQGTLWGKNTTGGAIAVVTKKPSLNPRENDNYVKLDYGSYDDKIVQAGVGFVIAPDALAARISGHIENRDGRFTNLFTGDQDNAIEDSVIRGQLLGRSGNFTALLGAHYRKYRTTGGYWTIGSYRADGLYRNGYAPPQDRDAVNTNAREDSDSNQYGGSLKLDYDFGAATLTSITGFERYETESFGDNDYTPLEIARNHTDAFSEQWSQELRLASNGSGAFKWILGAYYFNEKIRSDTASATLPNGSIPPQAGDTAGDAFSLTRYSHRAESGAAFANLGYDLTDTVNLTVGARFTRETKTLDFRRFSSAASTPAAPVAPPSWSSYAQWWDSYTGGFGGLGTFGGNLSRTWDNFTYDVTPSWQIAPDHLLYFKYAHGVKSGGFNTAAQVPAALQTVEPEELDSFEIGYKSSWFDGAVTFNVTAFHYQYDNVQINVVGPNPGAVAGTTTSYLQNAAQAHVNGAEFELTARPVAELALNAALGLLDTEYDKLQVVNGGANLSGAQFVRAPHVTLNVGASYDFDLGGAGKLQLGADARYQSHQYYYITPQDRVNRHLLNQPGYTLANARVAYTTPDERFTFTVYVNNLLDATYRNHALPQFNAANGITGDTIQWGDPRTWGASLVARF